MTSEHRTIVSAAVNQVMQLFLTFELHNKVICEDKYFVFTVKAHYGEAQIYQA